MPKLDIKKLKQYLIMFIGDKRQEKEFVEQYSAFYTSVLELGAAYGEYFIDSKEHGKKTIDSLGLHKLQDLYLKIIRSADAFKAVAAESNSRNTPELTGRIAAIDSFCEYINSDMISLSNVSAHGEMTLDEIFDDARSYTIDISGQNVDKAGANMSSRIPVSFTDKAGNERKGFFTPETKSSQNDETINMFSKAKDGHPEYDLALRNIIQDFRFEGYTADIGNVSETLKTYLQGDDILEAYKDIAKDILEDPTVDKGGLSDEEYDEYIKRLSGDEEFSMRVLNLMNDYAQIKNKYTVLETIGIDDQSIIEQRNAAMSVIGDLTGVPNLLARSVQMTVLQDGNKTRGVFMEFAEGSDLFHMKENDPLKEVTYEQLDNSEILKQIADLQVLDYICGNTDRHLGNMFYQFRDTENGRILSGITGIDNDNSFGKNEMSRTTGLMRLPGISSLMVINEETAARIKGLSYPMIKVALQNYSLSSAEMDAAWNRITALQQSILEGEVYYRNNPDAKIEPPRIKTVSNEDWKKLSLRDLSVREAQNNVPEGQYKNYFTDISTLPSVVKDTIAQKEREEEIQRKIEEKHPELKKEGSGFRMAKGEVLLETNKAGIADNNRSLASLESTMHSVNKGAFISSRQFDNVIKAFNTVKKMSFEMDEGVSNVYLNRLNEAYKALDENLTVYLDKKTKEKAEKTAKNKKISYTFEARVEFAEDLKAFVHERIEGLENELARTANAENFMSKSMAAKFSNYVKGRIERQNQNMIKEISNLPENDPYVTIKARAVNSRTVLNDYLSGNRIINNGVEEMLKVNIGSIILLQMVDNYRQRIGAGSKLEQRIGAMNSAEHESLSKAIAELPSIKKVVRNVNKQTIKEFLLDEKAASVIRRIPGDEREKLNRQLNNLINPRREPEVQKQPAKELF